MRHRILAGAFILCAVLGSVGGAAAATAQPVEEVGGNCGTSNRIGPLELWNRTTMPCDAAMSIINRFFDTTEATSQKYATIDGWNCGILGAAESDRLGGRAVDCRSPQGWLTLEQPATRIDPD